MARIGEAKRRALQIPLDHFRGARGVAAAKWMLAAAAGVAAAGWLAVGYFQPGGGNLRYAPAPVAAVHQMWEAECNACHIPFAPIRDDAAFVSWRRPQAGDASGESLPRRRASDRLCQACHLGPEHHPTQKPHEVASCASCHHEHQGRDADLNRVADHACTVCHADLDAHTRTVESAASFDPPLAAHVTSFAADHPPFRSLARDPGAIKFTHGRHTSLGLAPPGKEEASLTLKDLAPEDRDRYAEFAANSTGMIQLRCHACHRDDSQEPGRTAGAYMRPISFDRDCRACHPIALPVGGLPVRVPHGLSPREMRGILTAALLENQEEIGKIRRRAVPLSDLKPGAAPLSDRIELGTVIASQVSALERELSGECNKCHTLIEQENADGGLMPHVAPAAIPQVWFAHARFDHAAHRGVSCKDCHPEAYAEGYLEEDPAASHEQVMIPDRTLCVKCHRPVVADGSPGARHDCAQCHRYHAGVRPGDAFHGRVASSMSDAEQQLMRQWLLDDSSP
ncbi:MAG: cytochrome c3 family protein [Planctomycetes bacterium]|nr:cytochrome c3 family protein [Planctomycetota bacterium]